MYLSVSPYTTEHPFYLLAQCRSAQYGAFTYQRTIKSSTPMALPLSIFNSMNMMFIEFIKREDMPIKDLRNAIRRQNRTLVKAISG